MRNQGFTLLELLISITLVSVLLLGVTGLGSRFVGNIYTNQAKQDEIEAIYSALHLINQDTLSYHSNFTGKLDQVSILTVHKALIPSAEKSGQMIVGYRIATNGDESILYRKIKDNLMRTDGVETEIIRSSKITFSFLGEALEEHPVWQETTPVAWRVKIQDSAGREWQRTMPFMVRFNDAS